MNCCPFMISAFLDSFEEILAVIFCTYPRPLKPRAELRRSAGLDISLQDDEVAKTRNDIVMVMKDTVLKDHSPDFEIVDNPEAGNINFPDGLQLLSPLLELTPHDVDFASPVCIIIPACVGAHTGLHCKSDGKWEWETLEDAKFVAGHMVLHLRRFSHVGAFGDNSPEELLFQPYAKPGANFEVKGFIRHLHCTGCNTKLERWKGDPDSLYGFFACLPKTWGLGSLCDGDSISFQWKLGEEWSAQERKKLRYSTFPCVVQRAEEVSDCSASSMTFLFRWETCSGTEISDSEQQGVRIDSGEGATGVKTDTADMSARIRCAGATQMQVSCRVQPEQVEEIVRFVQETYPHYSVEADPRDPGRLQITVDVQDTSLTSSEIEQFGRTIFSDPRIFREKTTGSAAKREAVLAKPTNPLWKKNWFQTHMNCVAKAIEDCKRDRKNFQLIGVTPEIVNQYTRQEIPALFEFIWLCWQKNCRPFGDDKEFLYNNISVKSIPLGSLERELGRILRDGDTPIIMSCSEDMIEQVFSIRDRMNQNWPNQVKWVISRRDEAYFYSRITSFQLLPDLSSVLLSWIGFD